MFKAAQKASRALIRDFGELEHLQVSKKGTKDFVTAADLRAEKVIIEELLKARPNYSVISEESGETKGTDAEYRWVLDPLDGTINFLHGNVTFCTTIALEKTNYNGSKEIIAALTMAPVLKESYYAEKGAGAWAESENGMARRLRVAGRNNFNDCLFAIGSAYTDLKITDRLGPDTSGLRSIGSTALAMAYTASGRFDAFLQSSTNYWDVAAGILLIKEAGGLVTDFSSKQVKPGKTSILASNDDLHGKLLRAIKQP